MIMKIPASYLLFSICLLVLGACAGAIETEENTPEVLSPDALYLEAEEKITKGDAIGAKNTCMRLAESLEASSDKPNMETQARTAFCFAEVQRVEWEAVSMDATSLKICQQKLQAKIEGMRRLLASYDEIHEYKSKTWSIATGVQSAGVYEHFAKTLRATPTPSGLDTQNAKIFAQQFEDMALPLFDEANKRYAKVAQAAKKHGVQTKYARLAKERVRP